MTHNDKCYNRDSRGFQRGVLKTRVGHPRKASWKKQHGHWFTNLAFIIWKKEKDVLVSGHLGLRQSDMTEWVNNSKACSSCSFTLVGKGLLFNCSVVSDSLWPHGLQHARLPCPSLSPRVCSNSCPLSWWCHLTILSSVTPFCSCPQSFPASGSFLMSQLFTSNGQSIGTSVSASVLPMNFQGWFPLGLTGLILTNWGIGKIKYVPLWRCEASLRLIEAPVCL